MMDNVLFIVIFEDLNKKFFHGVEEITESQLFVNGV